MTFVDQALVADGLIFVARAGRRHRGKGAMRAAHCAQPRRRRTAYNGDDDLVFAHPHSGRPLDRTKLSRRFRQACADAGVRVVRFHDLRHTFATRLAASGQPMRTIQEFMGHADSKTTQIYAHYAPSAHEVEMLNAAFAEERPGAIEEHTAP
jgi:integrase